MGKPTDVSMKAFKDRSPGIPYLSGRLRACLWGLPFLSTGFLALKSSLHHQCNSSSLGFLQLTVAELIPLLLLVFRQEQTWRLARWKRLPLQVFILAKTMN